MKLLVANRGEIAVRVMRTARELGVPTVAVFSDVDRDALHVRMADEAVAIGGAPPAESYLRPDRLLAAARAAGATAVHPGYGFLSENVGFAEAVLAAGLGWIGPSPASMRAMSDKAAARKTAAALGVPVSVGADIAEPADAAALGFPLVVKAVAGGGGRGMRVVREPEALADAVVSARGEALAAFGDARLYAEALIEPARHVEVQVLGDGRGGVVTLGVRECSVQRRGQKLLEESPPPGLPDRLADALEAAAATLAAGVDYLGAGTVEFLLAPDGRFTFLEMNTRIQVEHGVTELLTGIDLVAAQLALAAGAPLPPRPTLRGHAIEVRVCAEDPRSAFAPAPGHLTRLRFPAGPGVRVDTGFEAGDSLPAEYDSLVAKVMALAEDRASAVARLARALDEVEIVGVPTTAGLLRAVLDSAEFRAGTVHTRWLEPWTAARPPEPDALARAAAAWVVAAGATGARATVRPAEASPWATLGAWR